MLKKIFIIFITTAFFISSMSWARDNEKSSSGMIRVCVANNADSINLKIKGPYTIETLHTREAIERSKRSLGFVVVRPTNSGMQIGGKEIDVYGIRIIPTVGANIFIDKRIFRGIVDIIRTKEMKLLVINHIDVEDYLYGVLYYETPHYWPLETLMAQAICARTFALYRKEERQNADYDLTNDVFSQVYGGKKGERWRTKRAVNLTKGEVLTYNGKIFPTYYHSICGGHTEDASLIWKTDLPPLKGRKCSYCKRARRLQWTASFSYKQIERDLNAYGIKCNNVSYIVEGKRDKSGRLMDVRIKDSKGIKDIPANDFRLALGSTNIKSTNFTIEITPKGIIFDGKGWGHGVGMCQWGAFAMAQNGYNYDEILYFYYPGAKIEKL